MNISMDTYLTNISNKLIANLTIGSLTLLEIVEHIVSTDSRFKTKISAKYKLQSNIIINNIILIVNTNNKQPYETNQPKYIVHKPYKAGYMTDKLAIQTFKMLPQSRYIVIGFKGVEGYWVVNTNSYMWAFVGTLKTAYSIIRLIQKDILPEKSSVLFKQKLMNLVDEDSNIFIQLTSIQPPE